MWLKDVTTDTNVCAAIDRYYRLHNQFFFSVSFCCFVYYAFHVALFRHNALKRHITMQFDFRKYSRFFECCDECRHVLQSTRKASNFIITIGQSSPFVENEK